MLAVFTFITLYGLSFFIWGSVGLIRFATERHQTGFQGRWFPALAMPAGGFLSTGLAFPFLFGAWPETGGVGGVDYAGVLEFSAAATLAAGVIGSYLAAFFSGAYLSLLSMLLFATAYWTGLWGLGFGGGVPSSSLPYAAALPAPAFALALISGWLGLRASPVLSSPVRGSSIGHAPPSSPSGGRINPEEVAVIIAAHNEGSSIDKCLSALTRVVPAERVYVGSDGSTDDTVANARKWGCNVWDIQPNRGKARTLKGLIDMYRLAERYRALMILDADSEIDEHYLARALPLFDDEAVAAVAGHVIPVWAAHRCPKWRMFFIAYRVRLYKVTQAFLRYGQTWKHTNVSFIVPGFASMYRCSVLPRIDISAPGLIIEDFNMTFELHRKHLGRIAYSPKVRCASQDPQNLRDYFRQVRRWDLGFWQTIRRHGIWPGLFWASLGTFIAEMIVQSITFLTVPFLLAWFIGYPNQPVHLWLPLGVERVTLMDVVIGVVLADYLLTAAVAALERKPILLIYGLGFIVPRWIDSLLFLATLPMAWFVKSDGRWISPKRA